MTLRRVNPLLLFGLLAVAVNVGLAVVLRHDHRPLVTAASCADFLVSLPALYYFLVIRAGVQPLISIVPVVLGGLFRVAYVAPVSGLGRMAIAGACECGIAWFLIRRGRQSLAARMFLSEITMLRYALASWARRPEVPSGGQAFSMHRNGGVATMFSLIAALSVIEAVCAHLVIQPWSVTAAWIVSGLSIYGALLLIALARSFRLRPIVITRDTVLIRAGLLWSVSVEAANIAQVQTSSTIPGFFRMTGMAEPNLFLDLSHEVIAEGLYGRRKSVRRIGISADQPRELSQAIRAVMTAQ